MSRLIIALAILLGCARVADAQDYRSEQESVLALPFRSNAHLSMNWEGAMGFGFRADVAVTKSSEGLSARDEIALTGGADFLVLDSTRTDPFIFLPTLGVQWTLGLSERLSFYPELGLVAETTREGWQGFFPSIGFGTRYHVWRSIAITGRLGWPIALALGGSF